MMQGLIENHERLGKHEDAKSLMKLKTFLETGHMWDEEEPKKYINDDAPECDVLTNKKYKKGSYII
jgi:hypothetical protein